MERFVYGEKFDVRLRHASYNDTVAQAIHLWIKIDGKVGLNDGAYNEPVAGYVMDSATTEKPEVYFGLHKIEGVWNVGANTGLSAGKNRSLIITEVDENA
jgi:hypothetical protein